MVRNGGGSVAGSGGDGSSNLIQCEAAFLDFSLTAGSSEGDVRCLSMYGKSDQGFARWALTMIVPRWERSAEVFVERPLSSSVTPSISGGTEYLFGRKLNVPVSCILEKVKGRSVVAPVLTPTTDPDRCEGFPRDRFMPRPSI